MTTKQEIIEYIDNEFLYDHDDDTFQGTFKQLENLQYMINRLKLRVKELEFIKSQDIIPMSKTPITLWKAKGTRWAIVKGYVVEGGRKGSYSYHVLLNNEIYEYIGYSSLVKAKQACRKHYEESILGNLEYE